MHKITAAITKTQNPTYKTNREWSNLNEFKTLFLNTDTSGFHIGPEDLSQTNIEPSKKITFNKRTKGTFIKEKSERISKLTIICANAKIKRYKNPKNCFFGVNVDVIKYDDKKISKNDTKNNNITIPSDRNIITH